jgi:hypothetical protein
MVKKARPIPVKKLIASLTFFCLTGLLPSLAAADLTPGTLDTGFNVGTVPDNPVLALAMENDGRILAGGSFNQINGINQPNLARIKKDGTMAGFVPQVDGAVYAIAVQPDSKILISGIFTAINGTAPKFQVTAGALPSGVSLNQETGVLSGTPKQVGIFTLTLSAYNQFPPTAAQTFTLTVDNAHYFMPLILRQ